MIKIILEYIKELFISIINKFKPEKTLEEKIEDMEMLIIKKQIIEDSLFITGNYGNSNSVELLKLHPNNNIRIYFDLWWNTQKCVGIKLWNPSIHIDNENLKSIDRLKGVIKRYQSYNENSWVCDLYDFCIHNWFLLTIEKGSLKHIKWWDYFIEIGKKRFEEFKWNLILKRYKELYANSESLIGLDDSFAKAKHNLLIKEQIDHLTKLIKN